MSDGPEARKDAADEALQCLGVIRPAQVAAKKDPIKEMEEFIGTIEDIDKRETMQAKLREIKANAELRAREAEARLRQGGDKVTSTNIGTEKPKRWTIAPDGKPIEDPEGEYESFAQAYKVAALDAAKAADPTAFFKFLKAEGIIGTKATGSDFTQDLAKRYLDLIEAQITNKGKSTDSQIIADLRSDISTLREEVKQSSDPVVIISKAKALTDGLRSAGLIPVPSAGGTGLEELKETHRHDEKMEEIHAEADYKKILGETISELPERIGRGVGSEILAREGAEEPGDSSGGGSRLEYMACTEQVNGKVCGTKIPVPPGVSQVTCPSCGTIYTRGAAGETEEKS